MHGHTPDKPPFQFGLAKLFWLTAAVAFAVWYGSRRPDIVLPFAAGVIFVCTPLFIELAISGLVRLAVGATRFSRKRHDEI